MFQATFCPKHAELILEINKILLLHQVGFFYIILPTLMMHGQTQIKFMLVVILAICSYNVTTHIQMWDTEHHLIHQNHSLKVLQTCTAIISISAGPFISFSMEIIMTHNFQFISQPLKFKQYRTLK